MNSELTEIKNEICNICKLLIFEFENEPESLEYDACRFELNRLKIICRNAKVTPKKIGQFVTFWKRNGNGPNEPFNEIEKIDFYTVNVRTEKNSDNLFSPIYFDKKRNNLNGQKKKENEHSEYIQTGM